MPKPERPRRGSAVASIAVFSIWRLGGLGSELQGTEHAQRWRICHHPEPRATRDCREVNDSAKRDGRNVTNHVGERWLQSRYPLQALLCRRLRKPDSSSPTSAKNVAGHLL